MNNLEKIRESIFTGNGEEAVKQAKAGLEGGISWKDILEKAMMPAMEKIGEEFSQGTAYLPELIASGDAMSKAMEVIKARIGDLALQRKGTIVLGTIYGDIHDIGKNIVKMNFEGAGFKVVDLGVDVNPEAFVQACKAEKVDLVGISALLSTTMWNMEKAVKKIREEEKGVKIMVGGAPLTETFAAQIGADGYASDGFQAVQKAKKLLARE